MTMTRMTNFHHKLLREPRELRVSCEARQSVALSYDMHNAWEPERDLSNPSLLRRHTHIHVHIHSRTLSFSLSLSLFPYTLTHTLFYAYTYIVCIRTRTLT